MRAAPTRRPSAISWRLGYDPFDAAGEHRVKVEIAKQRGKLVGRAEIAREGAARGVRELTGEVDRCEPLAAALATSVAIALDPVHGMRKEAILPLLPAPAPAPVPAPAPSTVIVVRERDTAPPAPPASAPAPLRLSLLGVAGATGAAAVAPGPMFGGEIGVMGRLDRFSLEASARAETTAGHALVASGDRLEATVFSGLLTPCAHLERFAGCVFGRVGALQARAVDVVQPSLKTSLFGALGLRIAYTLQVNDTFGLRAAFEGGLPLVRTSLEIDGTSVWTAPPAFVTGSIAGVVRFL